MKGASSTSITYWVQLQFIPPFYHPSIFIKFELQKNGKSTNCMKPYGAETLKFKAKRSNYVCVCNAEWFHRPPAKSWGDVQSHAPAFFPQFTLYNMQYSSTLRVCADMWVCVRQREKEKEGEREYQTL